MVKSWCSHGEVMVKSWWIHGEFMVNSWWGHGQAMVKPWSSRGEAMVKPWSSSQAHGLAHSQAQSQPHGQVQGKAHGQAHGLVTDKSGFLAQAACVRHVCLRAPCIAWSLLLPSFRLSFPLSFLFSLCLLLLTHFRESPVCENLFPPIFWHN